MAASSFFFAASPEFTVSTLWPSRRRAMSSISQMERSSSEIRILPMDPSGGRSVRVRRSGGMKLGEVAGFGAGPGPGSIDAPQPHYEDAALPRLGPRPDCAFVRLHNLVNDGQSQSRATLELRLEGFEDFFDHLRTHPGPGIGEADLPVAACGLKRNPEGPLGLHGTQSVFAEVPEDLLQLVAVGKNQGAPGSVMPFEADVGAFRRQTIFQERECVVEQGQQVGGRKAVLLAAGISQEIGDDAV